MWIFAFIFVTTYLYGDWTDVATVGMAVAVSIFVALVTACVRVGPPSAELAAYKTWNNSSVSGFLNLHWHSGLNNFFLQKAGSPGHYRMLSRVPDLSPLGSSRTPSGCDNQKGIQTLLNDPL
jgi:hypothetical protein